MLKRFFLSLLVFISISCGMDKGNLGIPNGKSSPSNAGNYNFSSLRWPNNNLPLVIVAPDSMKNEIEVSLFNACQKWNMAANMPLVTYQFENYEKTVTNLNAITSDRRFKLYFQNNWSLLSSENGTLALTFYTYSGNTMVEGDIVVNMNFSYFYSDLSGSTFQNMAQFDFESIIAHEIGHFLGAGHVSGDPTSVMKPFISNAQINRSLNADDQSRIYNKYH